MSNYDKYEEEINIFTLFWFVLSKWRSILIVAIIGLVLGAGYAVVSSGGDEALEGVAGSTEVAEEDLEYEIALRMYEASQERVAVLEEYMAESAIMELNPYELYSATATYVIDAPHSNLVMVDAMIYSYVMDGSLFSELEKVCPYSAKELDALTGIFQERGSEIVYSSDLNGQTSMRVCIQTKDRSEAEAVLAQVEESLDYCLLGLLQQGEIADYKMLNAEIQESTSTHLENYQADIRSKYSVERENLDVYKAGVEAAVAVNETIVTDTDIGKTSLIKFGGIGFGVGLFLMIIVWILMFFFTGKLYGVSNCEKCFGVKSLGEIYDFTKRKKFDLWILYKLNGIYSSFSLEEQKKIVLSNIKNELKKQPSIKTLFLVSSCEVSLIDEMGLANGLSDMGYCVHCCEKIIGNVDALNQLAKDGAVVILESKAQSNVKVINQELAILREYSDYILGMIVCGK